VGQGIDRHHGKGQGHDEQPPDQPQVHLKPEGKPAAPQQRKGQNHLHYIGQGSDAHDDDETVLQRNGQQAQTDIDQVPHHADQEVVLHDLEGLIDGQANVGEGLDHEGKAIDVGDDRQLGRVAKGLHQSPEPQAKEDRQEQPQEGDVANVGGRLLPCPGDVPDHKLLEAKGDQHVKDRHQGLGRRDLAHPLGLDVAHQDGKVDDPQHLGDALGHEKRRCVFGDGPNVAHPVRSRRQP